MDFLSCIICICLTWIIIQALHIILRSKAIPKKLPPGPKPFPVIGNLLDLGDKPHMSLANLAKVHGPIMRLKLGQVTTIVISSAAMAKEVLQTHDQLLSNRWIPDAFHGCRHDEFSLPLIPVSTRWKKLRRLCMEQLLSNKILDVNQDIRHKKVQDLLADNRQSSLTSEAVDIGRAAFKTTINMLSNTIYSMDMVDSNSDQAKELKGLVWNIMKDAGKPNLADYFPVLKKIDPQGLRHSVAVNFRRMLDLFDNIISQRLHLRKISGSNMNNDILDTLLNISDKNSEEMDKTKIERLFLLKILPLLSNSDCEISWRNVLGVTM
nr:geraniol 8-hydroxylase [Quercus suber]